jgi:sec-independent protein translocase protein TatB
MFDLSFEKLVVIAAIAVVILGPAKLPLYASKLAGFVRGLRDVSVEARGRMRQEMGADFDDVDWKKLDPRQYDPRRIIRDSLRDEERTPPGSN